MKVSEIVVELIKEAMGLGVGAGSTFEKHIKFNEKDGVYTFNFPRSWYFKRSEKTRYWTDMRTQIENHADHPSEGIEFRVRDSGFDRAWYPLDESTMWIVTASGPEGLVQFFKTFYIAISEKSQKIQSLIADLTRELKLVPDSKPEQPRTGHDSAAPTPGVASSINLAGSMPSAVQVLRQQVEAPKRESSEQTSQVVTGMTKGPG